MALMLIKHRGKEPVVHPTAYIAPTATLVGTDTFALAAQPFVGRCRWRSNQASRRAATSTRAGKFRTP
jgi:hypothetical protein